MLDRDHRDPKKLVEFTSDYKEHKDLLNLNPVGYGDQIFSLVFLDFILTVRE